VGSEEMKRSGAKTLGVILAGGASRRFGSDKALAELGGRPLISHVIARAAPQVDALVLNASGDFAATNLAVVPDRLLGEGPLSGLLAGLSWAKDHDFAYVATFSCDTPFFPTDIVALLHHALSDGADCAMARCCDQIHGTFALTRTSALPRIEEAFSSGLRSLKALGGILRCTFADISRDRTNPSCDAFFNINHPGDLELARTLSRRTASRV
jgi:molybdopterin-guanine dinucleotide biosynthesis protein A